MTSQEFSKRRDHLYIMSEILEVAIDGALKTQIMYRANLSFAQTNEYLKLLQDLLLLATNITGERTLYKTTPKGQRYIRSYSDLRTLLKKEVST